MRPSQTFTARPDIPKVRLSSFQTASHSASLSYTPATLVLPALASECSPYVKHLTSLISQVLSSLACTSFSRGPALCEAQNLGKVEFTKDLIRGMEIGLASCK